MTHLKYYVLLFGNYPDLAKRCLRSIVERVPVLKNRIVVGMNACCDETKRFVYDDLVDRGKISGEAIIDSTENIHKYPMMRRMFREFPPNGFSHVCWFDDDSYIKPTNYSWEGNLHSFLTNYNIDMCGSIYRMGLQGNQYLWMRAQPWYMGKPIPKNHTVRFATGGWWCLRTDILFRHSWPIEELDHRGGDVTLGELCRQQEYKLEHFNTDVAINADANGRESKAKKRGFDSKPIGYYYKPIPAQDYLTELPI